MKRRNRKLRKALLMTCCALALMAISVGATLAYLTDSEAVTNVFTVGKVDISLDEAKVNEDGEVISGDRVQENKYHLIPGKTYHKDPTVHVKGDSEDCWIFVKVENGLAAIEAAKGETEASKNIKYQILHKGIGWQELEGEEDVYYLKHSKQAGDKKYLVFDHFTLAGKDLTNEKLAEYAEAEIKVTAYAIQMAGFDTAEDAWKAGCEQNKDWEESSTNP